jgi:hypothetical protein
MSREEKEKDNRICVRLETALAKFKRSSGWLS